MIACRLSSYAPFHDAALGHLASLGVRWVELRAPAASEAETLAKRLKAAGLAALTLQGRLDLTKTDAKAQIAAQAAAFERLGAKYFLLAPPAGPVDGAAAYACIRAAAEALSQLGVGLLLETHPDLAGDADQALATVAAVDHPNLRINFDPANIGYYAGHDPVVELRRIAMHVGGVHLKDGSGRPGHRWFPALGQGEVDFPDLFRVLDDVGFDGPCTIEIEGRPDEVKVEEIVLLRVEASVAYLRRIGRFHP